MKFVMGSHVFANVQIPVLWGTRAVLQDVKGRLSVIDLSSYKAIVEILGEKPAPGSRYVMLVDGFAILNEDGERLYSFTPASKRLSTDVLGLPATEILPSQIRVGTNTFSSNMISGAAVGLSVQRESVSLGAPLPEGLARLRLPSG